MRALCDVPVGDRSLVIMASYEREPETQTKPRAHHVFVLNVVNLDFQPPSSLCERLRLGFSALWSWRSLAWFHLKCIFKFSSDDVDRFAKLVSPVVLAWP